MPLEIRYEPFPKPIINVYLKAGINTSFAVGKSRLDLRNDTTGITSIESKTVTDSYANTNNIFLSGNAGLGVRIGKRDKIHGKLECTLPIAFTPNIGEYHLKTGINSSFSLYLPLHY